MNESMEGKPMQFVRFPVDKPDKEAFNAGTREIGRLINERFTVNFQGLTQGVYFGWFVKQENTPQFTIEDDDGSIFVEAKQDTVWINVEGDYMELKGDAARLIVAWINRDADTIRAIVDKMETTK